MPSRVDASLSQDEQKALQLAAHVALARRDFSSYCTLIDPSYKTPPHIRLLCDTLMAVERGDILRLLIVMPPRHGKSETTSGKFPGWCLGRDPTRTIIMTSHTAGLIESYSGQNRDTIDMSPGWALTFPSVTINPRVRAADKWAVNHARESVVASGVQGGIAGYGAWLFIIDDPIKNYQEATSPTTRKNVWDWIRTIVKTRLTPDGRLVMITTRWHKEDPAGHFLEEEPDLVVIHLPATSFGSPADYVDQEECKRFPVASFPDPLKRPRGDPLWPERYGSQFLGNAKRSLKNDWWAIYQGMPTDPVGGKFVTHHIKPITPDLLKSLGAAPVRQARSWDLGQSQSAGADPTVGLRATLYKVEKGPGEGLPSVVLLLEDAAEWHLEWPESSASILRVAGADSPSVEMIVESVFIQSVQVKSLRKDPRLWRHRIIEYKPQQDKVMRAEHASRLIDAGIVFVSATVPGLMPDWAQSLLDQLAEFPNTDRDHYVDALSQLVNTWADDIDGLLLSLPKAEWVTPFSQVGPPPHERPFEFRDSNASISYDQLAWR